MPSKIITAFNAVVEHTGGRRRGGACALLLPLLWSLIGRWGNWEQERRRGRGGYESVLYTEAEPVLRGIFVADSDHGEYTRDTEPISFHVVGIVSHDGPQQVDQACAGAHLTGVSQMRGFFHQ